MAIVDREGCGHRSRFNRLLKMEGIQTQYRKCVRIEKRKITKKKKAVLLLLRFCAFLELIWSQPAPSLLLSLLSYYILSFHSFLSFHSLYVPCIDVQRVISEFQCRNPLGSRGDGDTGGKTAHTLHQNLRSMEYNTPL